MYTELRARESMQHNLVVYGLGPVSGANNVNDAENFSNICDVEFGFAPDIVRTTRLGKPNTGRIQPLLVSLKCEQQCKHLLSNAKTLRNSSIEYTRNNIFLSAQQTRAERQAAYEARCRKREQIAARQSADHTRQQVTQASPSTLAPRPAKQSHSHIPTEHTSRPTVVGANVDVRKPSHCEQPPVAAEVIDPPSQLRASAAEFTVSAAADAAPVVTASNSD